MSILKNFNYLLRIAVGVFSLTLLMSCSEPEEDTPAAVPAKPEKPVQGAMLLYISAENRESLFHWTFKSDRTTWTAYRGVWEGQNVFGPPGLTLVADDPWQFYDYSGVFKTRDPRGYDFGIVFYAMQNTESLHQSRYYYFRHTDKAIELREHTRNGEKTHTRIPYKLQPEKWHDFRVQVRGDRVDYYIDDSFVLAFAGLKHNSGGVGFWFNRPGSRINVSETRVQAFPSPRKTTIPDILQSREILANRKKGSVYCGEHLVRWFNFSDKVTRSSPPWLLVSTKNGDTILEINKKKPASSIVIQPGWCRDILANNKPVLAYTQGNRTQIISLHKPEEVLVKTSEYRNLVPKQLDQTPTLELLGRYAVFDPLSGLAAADQPHVPVILAYDGKQYHESTRQYPKVLRAELDEALKQLNQTTGNLQKAAILRTLGTYALLGEPYQGLGVIRARLPKQAKVWLNKVARHFIANVNYRVNRRELPIIKPGTQYATGYPREKIPIELVYPVTDMPAPNLGFVSLDHVLSAKNRVDPIKRQEALLQVIKIWFGPEVHQWTLDAIKQGYSVDDLFHLYPEYGSERSDKGKKFVYAVISKSRAPQQYIRVKVFAWLGRIQRLPPYWLIYDPDQDGKPSIAYSLNTLRDYHDKLEKKKKNKSTNE